MSKTKLEKQQKQFNDFISDFKNKGFRELTVDELFTVNGGKKKSSSSSSSSSGNSGTKNNTSTASSAAVTAATAGVSAGKNIGSANSNNKSNSGKPNNSTSSNSSSSSNNSISSSDKNSSNSQKSYTVQSGDTLSQITANYNKEHGTNYTYQQIAEKNGISNPDVIHPGQQISFGDNSQTEEQPAQQHTSSQNNSSGLHGGSGSDFCYEESDKYTNTIQEPDALNSDPMSDKDKIYAENHIYLGKAEDEQKRTIDYINRKTTNKYIKSTLQTNKTYQLGVGIGVFAVIAGSFEIGVCYSEKDGFDIYRTVGGGCGVGITGDITFSTNYSNLGKESLHRLTTSTTQIGVGPILNYAMPSGKFSGIGGIGVGGGTLWTYTRTFKGDIKDFFGLFGKKD